MKPMLTRLLSSPEEKAQKMDRDREFAMALFDEVLSDVYTFQADNTDCDRFGNSPLTSRIKERLRAFLVGRGVFVSNPGTSTVYRANIAALGESLAGLGELYELLADQASRDLLVKLIAYRTLGRDRVRLPINNSRFWRERSTVDSLFDKIDTIKAGSIWTLKRARLAAIGYPLELYCLGGGLHCTFELRQYEYPHSKPPIKAEKGDAVIDAGGCWGDTTLYFANEVGPEGNVYSFEFIPSNLAVMQKNLALNDELKNRVQVIDQPLWETSGETLFFTDNGPASRVSPTKPSDDCGTTSTITIDDFARQNRIPRIDFIKMDIEGAELSALKGSLETIRNYKPKLAISIYHTLSDFVSIPRLIASLDLGYRFYLGHYTIHAEETVLFAVAAD